MLSGHGKMDDRGTKFNSAFTYKIPTHYCSPSSSFQLHKMDEEPSHSTNWPASSPSDLRSMSGSAAVRGDSYHQANDTISTEDGGGGDEDTSTLFFSPIISSNVTSSTSTTLQINLTHSKRIQGLHHRSRIKQDISSPYDFQSPVAKQIGTRRRKETTSPRRSSIHSSLSSTSASSSSEYSSFPHSSTTSSSPSRFLLTFLSSCHLVQVTSRLVVALAMTSLLLILVHVMPGAYCSSSTISMYSSSSSSSSPSSGGATKRAYFNQSVHQFKVYNPSLSSSSSSLSADVLSSVDLRNPAFWIKTRWPIIAKSKSKRGREANEDVVVEVENVNNKLYSKNQLAIRNDYDNQNNILLNGENLSAKNDIGSSAANKFNANIDHKKLTDESSAIEDNTRKQARNNNVEDDYNGNNNRSNYYYDSFVVGKARRSSQNQSSSLSHKNNSGITLNKNTYLAGSSDKLDNTQEQPRNRGSYYELTDSDKTPTQDFPEIEIDAEEKGEEEDEGEDEDRASTAKVGITNSNAGSQAGVTTGNHNGTTRAEREAIANVSSTGVRPTMAFTKSYYGRQQIKDEENAGANKEIIGKHFPEELEGDDEVYNGPDDDMVDIMQSDQSDPHFANSAHQYVEDVNELGRGRNGNYDGNEFSLPSSSGKGKQKDSSGTGNTLSSFSSSSEQQQAAHHHISSIPTATTSPTKVFKTSAAAGGGSSPSYFSSAAGASTSLFSPPSPSSSAVGVVASSSSPSKLKSIKSEHHLSSAAVSPFSSSATLVHYPNEHTAAATSSANNNLLGKSKSSASPFPNHNPHHNPSTHQHYHRYSNNISSPHSSSETRGEEKQQQQRQHSPSTNHHHQHHLDSKKKDEVEEEIRLTGNSVASFTQEDYDVIEDTLGGGGGGNDDVVDAVEVEEMVDGSTNGDNGDINNFSSKEKMGNVDTRGEDDNVSLPQSTISQSTSFQKLKPTRQNNKSMTKVPSPNTFHQDGHGGEEDGGGELKLLPPTAAALKTFSKQKIIQLQPEQALDVDIMQADDPSIYTTGSRGDGGASDIRDNLVGPFATSKSSSSSSRSSFMNKNNNNTSSSSFNKLVTLGSTASASSSSSPSSTTNFSTPNGRHRSPLQIRRDLSRLIANAAGKSTVGPNGGSSVIGADEEPLPNKCDRVFMANGPGPSNGTFESPTMISEEGHLYQCMFMFVSRPMERVEVVFQQFNVRGTPPECVHEWVDIWTEVEGTDPTDLVTTPFSGRYCGKIPPRRRISLYGGIAIGFYSDKNSTDETIFRGTYAFINDSPYQIGTPVPRTLCSYTILGASKRNGDLISPTYPGVYPKNLSCSYKFIGIEGQRIRLEFRDFDVFYGGSHCPFDEVKVYDGMDPTAPLIGIYCGQQRNLVVFSSAHLMLVTFTTLERSTEAQNRGFKGVWEFSESFVKLDFIEKNMGTHIRGTECDQRILSKGQSSGVVYSPNYPFPYVPKIVCRYFVYGLQDPQHLERVRLAFEKFDVVTNINSEEDTTNQSEAKKCGDGFLKVYLKGQEVIQAYDKADYEFCGKEMPHDVVSDGPRLVLVFSSGEAVGSGFKARYQFETEYRVPGTAAPDGSCHFIYFSSSRLKGEFNSPRFPSNYPSRTNCTFIFNQQPNEQVRIVFDNFKMKSDKFNLTDRGAYGDFCEEDWVEIWNVMPDSEDRLMGRFCGSTAPGPIESREKAQALKVILHTDDEGVSSGFKARYIFFTAKTIFGECGQNITQAQSGVLTSPKWPQKYDGPSKGEGSATCNWYLSVRPGSRVMLHFQNFAIEGEPNGRGCPAAAVRIWVDPDGVPVELCGETLNLENSQYVSTRNLMRVTFITADKAVGAPGFRAVWTEVQEVPRLSNGAPCHHSYFRCEKSLFCIPPELKCDSVNNCGTNDAETDQSDEEQCGPVFGDMNAVIAIVVGVAISLFIIVLLCAWGQRRKRRRRRRLQLRRPPIHVCDNAGARFAAMDSV